jgi:predicted amidohydrolase
MRIALAQISPAPRDLLQRHLEQIALASARRCDLIAFPELSLTGYHPTDVTRAPSNPEDQQITKLEDACKTHGISAIVGAPLWQGAQVLIGALLISPGEATRWYAKRHLHEDEVPFFAEGMREPLFLCQGARVGLAICYELFVPQHRELLAALSPQLIIASVAKHTHGLERARGARAQRARAPPPRPPRRARARQQDANASGQRRWTLRRFCGRWRFVLVRCERRTQCVFGPRS